MTLTEIRNRLSAAYRKTWFVARTNETYYPARWTYGDGAGSATTATFYDRRVAVAAEHVAGTLDLNMGGMFDDCARLRDAASMIAAELRRQATADAAEDAAAEQQIA